jgi:2-dehydro-3-deoxyphosphogluconate aldolase/(4S)-4-hydroxy-2-oxoglutarate aldolase
MNKREVLETIGKKKLVPVIRTATADDARWIVEVLANSGISVFEVTLTILNAVDFIRELSASNPDLLIGAGTVLTLEQAQASINAGAKFIVSPIFEPEVVKLCNNSEVCAIPAGLTPTEIYNAWQSGADAVKVFPCGAVGGPSYIKAVKSVFPEIKVMPTGGVRVAAINDFLQAGAFAVGVGADLIDQELVRTGQTEEIISRTKQILDSIGASS